MSAIHDLIAQISDSRLRERLLAEWAVASQTKKFGLVFEDHLPELLPLYGVKPRKGDLVCLKQGSLKNIWQVRDVNGNTVACVKPQDEVHPSEPVLSSKNPVNFLLDELLVVREFGEPIFPSLVPIDSVSNGPISAPWHTLIEADNYHALQLLDYLYAGQVDCIYIDPPYNTGARDWKYNNDYIDKNDGWRHSKWLAFMEKRLKMAKRLLKPDTGVLIVTIDEHEVHHLGMLLEQVYPESYRQLVTIVVNPKGVTQGRFSRVEEYAIFCFGPNAFVSGSNDNLLNPPEKNKKPRWKGLLRSGTNARREDRKNMFYPVYIDESIGKVVGAGEALPYEQEPVLGEKVNGYFAAWPIRSDGSYGNWGVGFSSFRKLIDKGYVSCGRYDEKRKTYGISYISEPNQKLIESGGIVITGRDEITNTVTIEYTTDANRSIKTMWHRTRHDAGAYGTDFLKNILGVTGKFNFPKSIYSTFDAIASVTRNNPNALIVDFFSGSGTTLNAVNLLNSIDDGQRRCILVTNNEVSSEEAELLRSRDLQPGDDGWEMHGICRSVTWPRSKFTILGQRENGTKIPGEYLTGKTVEVEKPRSFTHISFIDPANLDTTAKKKQLVALIDGLPQTLVSDSCSFVVSEDSKISVLFDPIASEAWLQALEDSDHISQFYIVTPVKKVFDSLKAKVIDLLGPTIELEDEKRPISLGFSSNLAYFKIGFLDKNKISLRYAFREILPLLWLKSGAVGPRPELPENISEPNVFAPEHNNFIVLLEESRIASLMRILKDRKNLSYIFIVTDSEESFKAIGAEVQGVYGANNPELQFIQLYKDYLANFMINKLQESASRATPVIQS